MARKARKDSNGTAGEVGHNSAGAEDIGNEEAQRPPIDAVSLQEYVQRAAEVMRDQKELGGQLKDICAEGDEAGVASKKEIRRLARESLMDGEVLRAQLDRMEALRRALGEFVTTPLGQSAEDAARQ